MLAIVTVDFDGTLYKGNSFKAMIEIGKREFTYKQWAVVAAGLVKASAFGLTKGKNSFKHEFFKSFAKTFKGKTSTELNSFFQQLVEYGKTEVHQELVLKIREHQENGDTVILLSGALQPFLKALTKDLQLDVHILSTELLYNDQDRCTGEIGTIVNGTVKVEKLKEWLVKQQLEENSLKEIWAYADSESDLPLLQFVHYPIIVNPKEDMVKIAEQNKWPIFAS
jgi:HAD superfamily hydrolase (TIGR01490 family)